jgi:hypothetical protein
MLDLHNATSVHMSVGELIAQFWLSVTIVFVIVSLSIFSIVCVLRSKTFSCSETWTEKERNRIRWLEIGTGSAMVLCWTGALISLAYSPLWADRAINWSFFKGDTPVLDVSMLGIVVIGLPTLSTAFWLKLLRHNWSDGEAPSVSTYLLSYSLWLAFIWSKILIGW